MPEYLKSENVSVTKQSGGLVGYNLKKSDHLLLQMRVLKIESVLSWNKMRVYEEIDSNDFVELPYSEATSRNLWKSLLILSWRWGSLSLHPMRYDS